MVERPWEPLLFLPAAAAKSERAWVPGGRRRPHVRAPARRLSAAQAVTENRGNNASCAAFHSLNVASSSRCSSRLLWASDVMVLLAIIIQLLNEKG